jgi:23S rRNA (adenine2030-N6)-methyltransferase
VPSHPSRYRPDAPADYSHRFHAGNVGDVWKHCALVETLGTAATSARRISFLDTHAGEGRYALGATGEWTEGIGRWRDASHPVPGGAVARYLAVYRRLAGDARSYPGSPALARAALGPGADIALWERDEVAVARLRLHTQDDARTRVVHGDGLAALGEAVRDAEAHADGVVVLVDPPWLQKADWTVVPDRLAAAVRGSARATFVLWYPVKSLTRPNAMIARLRAAGVAVTVAELVTTPLSHQRQRLNGSGVLLVRPPAGVLEALAAAAPVVGVRSATHGTWSFRMDG